MKLSILFLLILLCAANAFAYGMEEIVGRWRTAGDSSEVEFYRCGEKLCGKVAWLKNTNYINSKDGPIGTPKTDRKNPDATLQNRSILGLQVIEGLTATGEHRWENGSCYDPESGNSYKCKIHLASPGQLEIRGFIGFSVLGRTYTLTRRETVVSTMKIGN